MTDKTPRKLILTGRRWFDRPNGNTYFSASAELDGQTVAHIAFEYGYGDHWLDRICEELNKAAVVRARKFYPSYGGSGKIAQVPHEWIRAIEADGVAVFTAVTDVKRKKDL